MKNALIAALVAAAAVLVWIALRGDDRAPAAVPATPEAAGTGAPTPEATATDTTARREVEPAAAPTANAATVTLKGRCVDAATGTPLGDCEVRVFGDESRERLDAFLEAGGEVEWKRPARQITEPDGAFAFTFVPPPPYQFRLYITATERVPLNRLWPTLEPGAVVDVGDVALRRGTRVSGHVADSDGVVQDGVEVYLRRAGPQPPPGAFAPRGSHSTRTDASGTFALDGLVPSGTWRVRVRDRQVVEPSTFEIPKDQAHTRLAIETVPLADLETITGIVVDETGAPLGGVGVGYDPRGGGRGFTIVSAEDGTFVVDRRPGDPEGPIRLRFDREGYEDLTSAERHPWGTTDLRFVLRRGLSVDVTVTDGDTGEPIEDYGVRCFPEPGGRMVSTDYEVRNRDHHPGGQTRIYGIGRGRHVLVVEPTGATWPTSDFVRFEVTDAGAPPQHVALFRNVTQTLRVRAGSGRPVAGTVVELLRPLGEEPVTVATRAVTIPGMIRSNAEKALAVQEGETDASGELVLRGPPRTPLALRVLGPGHQPWCDPAVTLVEGAPLVVTVSTGATVTGEIGPAELLRWLRESRFPAGVLLEREAPGGRESFPGSWPGEAVRLDEDGAFVVAGIPPGTWNAYLTYSFSHGEGRGSSQRSVFLQALTGLTDGEERELNAELGPLLPGTLSGTVLLNDRPLAGATVHLVGRRPDGKGGEQRLYGAIVETGPDGAFAAAAEPATYRLSVEVTYGVQLPAEEAVSVAPSQDAEQVFHVRSGALRLRVLRADGQPVAGLEVSASTADGTWRTKAPQTDDDGRTTLAAAPPGTLVLTAIPKRLLDPKVRQEFWKTHAGDPHAEKNAMLQLGRAEIAAGDEPNEVEVRLPASSEY